MQQSFDAVTMALHMEASLNTMEERNRSNVFDATPLSQITFSLRSFLNAWFSFVHALKTVKRRVTLHVKLTCDTMSLHKCFGAVPCLAITFG